MEVTGFRPLHTLSAAIDRFTAGAGSWSALRTADEGLDLVRDAAWADACALIRILDGMAVPVHRRPAEGDPREHAPCVEVPVEWFPWGLAPVSADRFLLVEDATRLPTSPEEGSPTLGELGYSSCLHLPLRGRPGPAGALQVFWRDPRLAWDDDRGRLLRTLGRFLLDHCRPPASGPAG